MKLRIISDGKNWKVQQLYWFIWITLCRWDSYYTKDHANLHDALTTVTYEKDIEQRVKEKREAKRNAPKYIVVWP